MAGQEERDGFTSIRPSGAAMIVVFPLSSTTALNRLAASRVAATRSAPGGLPVSRSNSRSCGVSTSGVPGSRLSASSGCRASRVIASASATTGSPAASTCATTSRPAAPVPNPGPTAQAWTCPASATDPVATTSGQRARTTSAAVPANRTMPEVASTAAPVLSTAAPG